MQPIVRSVGSEPIRFGLIVPSSNVTMERELPEMLRRREEIAPERFSFHASRVRMKNVTPADLAAMNLQATRAIGELSDASVDVVAYACLVAVMAEGPQAHLTTEAKLTALLETEGLSSPVVTSAGALVDTLRDIDAHKIAVIAPYMPALTAKVCDYISAEGVTIEEVRSLSVSDNGWVGRLDPQNLIRIAREMTRNVDAFVVSACVQMPSLEVIETIEREIGVPVVSAATATVFQSLRRLRLATTVPGAGHLLSGAFDLVHA